MRTWGWLVTFALLVVLLPAAAWAQEGPTAAEKESARNLMDLGDKKVGAGDFAGALKAFQGADAIMNVPSTKLEVGRAQAALGLLLEARGTMLAIQRLPKTPGEPPVFVEARANARQLADEYAARIPSLTIVVAGAPEGAELTIEVDGVALPTEAIGLPWRVNPGSRRVTVHNADLGGTATVEVAEREVKQVTVTVSTAGAVAPEPETSAGGVSPLVYVGFGIGGVGAIVGAITGGISFSQAKSIEEQCGGPVCTPDRQSDIDGMTTLANVSNAMFAVGAAGVVVGVVGLVLSGDDADESDSAIVPLLGPGFVGVQGRF